MKWFAIWCKFSLDNIHISCAAGRRDPSLAWSYYDLIATTTIFVSSPAITAALLLGRMIFYAFFVAAIYRCPSADAKISLVQASWQLSACVLEEWSVLGNRLSWSSCAVILRRTIWFVFAAAMVLLHCDSQLNHCFASANWMWWRRRRGYWLGNLYCGSLVVPFRLFDQELWYFTSGSWRPHQNSTFVSTVAEGLCSTAAAVVVAMGYCDLFSVCSVTPIYN